MKYPKKFILLLGLVILLIGMGKAQSVVVERELVSSAGNVFDNGSIRYSATVGELAVKSVQTAGLKITEGIQHPHYEEVGLEELNRLGLTVSAYPNPAQQAIIVEITAERTLDLYFSTYDLSGRQMISERKIPVSQGFTKEKVVVSDLPQGVYFLVLKDKNGQSLQTFKIVKE